MINLKVYRKTAEAFTDLLQYAVMLDENVVLCKNGSLMCCIGYNGKDVESSTPEELNVNSEVKRTAVDLFGSGWCTFHNVCRRESSEYMPHTELDDFPDPASRLIELERRQRVSEQGTTYENTYVMTVCWMPESVKVGKARDMMYTVDGDVQEKSSLADRNLKYFKATVSDYMDRLSSLLSVRLLGNYVVHIDGYEGSEGYEQTNNEVLEHLNYCVSGESVSFALPENTMYLDCVIGGYDFYSGISPVVGDKHVSTIVIDGFPMNSCPQILAGLDALPFQYRWSNRFIYLDEHEAIAETNLSLIHI